MSSKDVQKWLDTPGGQKWSEANHRIGSRDGGSGTTGSFGEIKSQTESCDWHGRCKFTGKDGKGGCR